MEHLALYVMKNSSLKSLDISWNDLPPKAYAPLIKALGENK